MSKTRSFGKGNIVRGAMGIGIGAAIFSGSIHHGWPIVVAIAYGLGALSMRGRAGIAPVQAQSPPPAVAWTPPTPVRPAAPSYPPASAYEPPARPTATPATPATPATGLSQSAQIAARLDGLVARISKLVSSDVLALVQSIVTSIEEILPMLDRDRAAVGDADAFTIRQTALHYLPDTMAAYFRLPPSYRTTQPLENGKTARTILLEQLTVLDLKMKEVAKNLAGNDAQALLANGHFLRERFATDLFTTV